MSEPRDSDSDLLRETQMLRVNRLCNEFEAGWQAGQPVRLEEVVADLEETDCRAALRDLLPLEIEYRRRAGETVELEDYTQRFPHADRDWLASLFQTTSHGTALYLTPLPVPERLGDYQIIEHIGGGGMGTVYKALHVRMGRVVALKVLRPEIQQNRQLVQRFDREVRAAARLTHPNIVAALDAREQDGLHFLITEFIDGMDLEAKLRSSGPLPVAVAADFVLQAARGLDYAHHQGVIHRDIKPANLLRDQHGVVKILDMGLARLDADTVTTATDLTNSGMVLGTAAYMAPEQARDIRRADARSDIYSLGCTLFYLLTGRHAFSGATALDTVLSHLSQPIPSLTAADASIPPALEEIFRRMVAKDPNDRYQTAAELVRALEQLKLPSSSLSQITAVHRQLSQQAVTPTVAHDVATSPTQVSGQPRRPNRMLAPAALWTVGLVLLVIAAVPLLKPASPPQPAQAPPNIGRNALSFDGTSSYVLARTLRPSPGETYTIEVVAEPLVHRLSNVFSWLGPDWMALYLDDGRWGLARRVQGESHITLSEARADLGKTVHLAGVFRGPQLDLFVDGMPTTSQPVEFQLPVSDGGLYIGGVPLHHFPDDPRDRFFSGRIHAIHISKGRRYVAAFEPPESFQADPQTLALYRFHAGRGKVVKDESGNGHDADIHGAKWTPISNKKP